MRRVVVTGMGCISPLGLNARDTWKAMCEGICAIAPIESVPRDSLRCGIAAEVHDFDPQAHFDPKRLILLDRFSQFALVAAAEAIAQSGLALDTPELSPRTACVIGTGIGGELTHDESARRMYAEGKPRLHPLTIVRLMANAPSSQISMAFGVRGPAYAVSSACASSNHAIAQAFDLIRNGRADVAISGGSEACISLGGMRAWEAMRVLADDTCRPFSKQRHGLVLGEGAGIFVLEALPHAQARGATILAELAGIGQSADAGDIVYPSAEGAASAIRGALADGGLNVDQVDYINAHGTGTQANDCTETGAIHLALGSHAQRVAVSSTKSMHGHALGAAGAIELVAVLGALREGVVPPTVNFIDPDPQCDLDYVPNVARDMPVHAALSHSFAFGGLNAVLALRRWPN